MLWILKVVLIWLITYLLAHQLFLSTSQAITSTPFPSPIITTTPTNTPTPTPVLTGFRLSEIMACPAEGSEWVEILNHSPNSLSLSNWSIWDSSTKIYDFTATVPLTSQQVVVVEITNKLNNTGDTVKLLNPIQEVIDSHAYTTCATDQSWSFLSDQWFNSPPSRGFPNLIMPSATPQPVALLLTNTPAAYPSLVSGPFQPTVKPTELTPTPSDPPTPTQLTSTPFPRKLPHLHLQPLLSAASGSSALSAMYSETTVSSRVIAQKPLTATPFLSVIMGGLLLLCVGSYLLYVLAQKRVTSHV